MPLLKKSILVLLIAITQLSLAQKKEPNYGEAPDSCKKMHTTMLYYHKLKQHDDAAKSWRWCFYRCPEATKNIYIVGEKIFKHKIGKASKQPELKAKLVDTLLMIYDQRIKFFPGNGNYVYKIKGKKGRALADYRSKEKIEEAYYLLDTAITQLGVNTSSSIGTGYIFAAKKMLKLGKIDCNDMINAYLKVSIVVNANIDKKPKRFKTLKDRAVKIANECLNCEVIDSIYSSEFELNQNDTSWLDSGIELLSAKNCSSSEVLVKILAKRYESAPKAKTAIQLAQYYGGKKNIQLATKYFNDAISIEKDPEKLVKYYIKKANFHNSNGQSSTGFQTAKKALSLNPNSAKAYLALGDAIVYGASSCKDLKFGGSEIYWVAVDYYTKAGVLAKNDKVKSRALKNAKKYANYFPVQQTIFMQNINEGDKYTVGCWINVETSVRKKK